MNRIEVTQSQLGELDALIIDDPIDLYYLTGMSLSLGRLLIEPSQATLFVDGRYLEACEKESPIPVSIWDWKTPFPIKPNSRVGFDSQKMTYDQAKQLESLNIKLIPVKGPITKQRQIKDATEIAKLRDAATLGMKGFNHVLDLLKSGISEEELALELELFWRKSGGERLAFEPIIAFAENGSKPHYRSGKRKLAIGDCVLIDLGVVLNRYHSDMTRVVFFKESSKEMEKIYHIVLKAQETALSLCRAGVCIEELYKAAKDVIEGEGYKFIHSLGHGIGLEIHEPPRIASGKEVLVKNMVITIEPGIYVPGLGGVRIEDTIVINSSGFDNLTQSTQKSIRYI